MLRHHIRFVNKPMSGFGRVSFVFILGDCLCEMGTTYARIMANSLIENEY